MVGEVSLLGVVELVPENTSWLREAEKVILHANIQHVTEGFFQPFTNHISNTTEILAPDFRKNLHTTFDSKKLRQDASNVF